MGTEEIQAYLYRHIPLSREMAVEVVSADEAGVRLRAPLEPNINHRHTVFGGSASALAILAAWTLVHAGLQRRGTPGGVVIQRNSLEYLHPIHGAFEAHCPAPPEREWERFVQTMERRGRSRIVLNAQVLDGQVVAAVFQGVYVAHALTAADAA